MSSFVILALVVIAMLYVLSTYNSLVRMKNKVKEAFSTMDVYLKKRFDLIPNIVATVKGYAKHEAETLEKVIAMRNGARSTGEQIEAEKQITQAVHNIMVVAEQYPQLQANQQFLNLQAQLEQCEKDIANARLYYNGTVRQFNDKIMTVPSNLVASMFHFTEQPMFEVDSADERKNVKVEF